MQSPVLVVATLNLKKGIEMQTILSDSGWQIKTLADFPGGDVETEETGDTFEENSRIKAVAASQLTGEICIADDGGLCIDYLDGAPGVFSKRFLGENSTFEEKMNHILEMMKDVPWENRTCRFRCVVTIALPDGQVFQTSGACEAHVGYELKGSNGFGYDPIVVVDSVGKHMAELTPSEKHKISHRGAALASARVKLNELMTAKAI